LQANGRTGLLFGRALKVARQVAAAGAECAVCELIVVGAVGGGGGGRCAAVWASVTARWVVVRRAATAAAVAAATPEARLLPAVSTCRPDSVRYATPSRVLAVLRFFTVVKQILHYRCLTAPCPGLPA